MAELGLFNAESRLQEMLGRRREQMQQQRDQMSQLFGGAANTNRGAVANATAAQVGSGFGQGLARGLFGEGEQIEQARAEEETVGGIDPNDPMTYIEAGRSLMESNPTMGVQLQQYGLQQNKQLAAKAREGQSRQALIEQAENQGFSDIVELAKDPNTPIKTVTSQLQKRVEDSKKAPATISVPEGDETVSKKWSPEKGSFEEISRGQRFASPDKQEFNFPGELPDIKFLASRYDSQVKPFKEDQQIIRKIRAAAATEGGASPQALQSGISQLFGGDNVRAFAELERWRNFGSLPERVSNSITRFLKGDYTDGAYEDVKLLVNEYEKLTNEALNDIESNYIDQAKDFDIAPTAIVGYNSPLLRDSKYGEQEGQKNNSPNNGNQQETPDPLGIR